MNKRQLLQAIERMPNEAEVEMRLPDDTFGSLPPTEPIAVTVAEFVDGKIRIS